MTGIVKYRQQSVIRTWELMAKELNGKCEIEGTKKRLKVKGTYESFNAFITQDISHDDAIPYPHTRGSLNLRNPAMMIMGMRHKSALEEVQTRKEVPTIVTGQSDFDKSFFLVSNVEELAPVLIPDEAKKSLLKYNDIEIYLRASRIEWRRAGLVRSLEDMKEHFRVIHMIGQLVEALPPRTVSLTQKMQDEALIEKGV